MSFKTTFSHLLIHAFSEVHQPQFPRVRCPVSWTFFCEIQARPVVWIGTTVISSLSIFSNLWIFGSSGLIVASASFNNAPNSGRFFQTGKFEGSRSEIVLDSLEIIRKFSQRLAEETILPSFSPIFGKFALIDKFKVYRNPDFAKIALNADHNVSVDSEMGDNPCLEPFRIAGLCKELLCLGRVIFASL